MRTHRPERANPRRRAIVSRTTLRRAALVLAGMSLAVTALTACSDEGDSSEGGEVTLSYAVWDQAQVPAMEKIIAEFRRAIRRSTWRSR